MDRFVTRRPACSHRPMGYKRIVQRRLEDLGKVVRLDRGATALNFANEDLLRAKVILDAQDSSEADLLTQLRKLSVYMIQESNLLQSQLGHSVRRLKQSGCPEVKQLAGRLIDKWRALIKGGKQPRSKQSNNPFGCRDKVATKLSSSNTVLSSQTNQGWQNIPADSQCTSALTSKNSFAICKPTDINFPGYE